jgi:hypothetical protein
MAVLLPVAAWAEPIGVTHHSSTAGFSQSGTTISDQTIDLGTISMVGGQEGILLVDGLRTWVNYGVSFSLEGIGNATTLRIEILDPLGDGDDDRDPAQPGYVPAGWSTSQNEDGFSFAQAAGLQRSALFAGGAATVNVDELTHRGDVLMFSGLNGGEAARVMFGLRDSAGGRSFLLRFSTDGSDNVATPEPASMLLLGTGLAGIYGVQRRRRKAAAAQG